MKLEGAHCKPSFHCSPPREGDMIKTAPRYGYASPPKAAAERAFRACLAVPADSETARRLREGAHHNAVGNSWHQPAQHLCIDIYREDLKPAPGAVETIGEARAGTAVVT